VILRKILLAVFIVGVVILLVLGNDSPSQPVPDSQFMIERGKYLATIVDCQGCHTPIVMTDQGPGPDTTRRLSGYPGDMPLPDVPWDLFGPGRWSVLANDGNAFAGLWGVSFPRNLTPDVETGLGSWTPEIFIKAIRTGKDMGEGRDILPPMPWQAFAKMTDDDLRALFAYLQSLPPIHNPVPDPISFTGEHLPTLSPALK
jgi:hypothetical protein